MTTRPSRGRAIIFIAAGTAIVALAGVSIHAAATSNPAADGTPSPFTSAAASPGAASPGAAESVTPSPTALASPWSAAPGHPTPDDTAAPTDPSPDPQQPSPKPTDDAGPQIFEVPFAPVEKIDPQSAEVLVGAALTAPDADRAVAESDLERAFADIAADAYREEIEAEWLEMSASGWSLRGERRVDDLEITSLDGDAATIVACIDASDVTLVDAEGEPVGSQSARMTRAEHVFTLARDGGVWRVTDRTFPDDPTC